MTSGRPIRVAMTTPYFLPHTGGVEQHVAEVAARMTAAGEATVSVLTTGAEEGLPARETMGGVVVHRHRALPRGRDWLWAPGLGREIAAGDWDLVHVQSYHTLVAPIAMRAARSAGLPYVVTFHGGGSSSVLRTRLRGAQRRMLRPLLRGADALVAVAGFEAAVYGDELGLAPDRFTLIPNGFDLPEPGPLPHDAPAGAPLIASVGRLEEYKGHQHAIAAMPAVLRTHPDARLWIAGSGPYEPQLRAQIATLGLQDHVTIHAVPPRSRAEMAARLAACDLVVLLSAFETHPVAVLEAIALGRPVLVAPGSGTGELADRGLARAVDPHDPEAVAAAITRELRDPLRPGAADLPTWDGCAAALLALYRTVLERRCAS